MSHSKRYFEMLGAAYDVPSGTDRFDTFLSAAMAYFFAGDETGALAPDVPRFNEGDDALDAHGGRIGALVTAAASEEAEPAAMFHAILEISAQTEKVSGNQAAAHLMDRDFPCDLEDLPLDFAALSDIRRFMKPEAAKAQDRIILANVEAAQQLRACLALIQRPIDRQGKVIVSLSYIDWSETLIERLGEAFGLTGSETEVLEGYLGNLTQKEIAADRDRALETIKVQSKSILRKTGCARMSDVVQLCASIAFLLRQLPEQSFPSEALGWVTPRFGLSMLDLGKGRQLAWYKIGSGTKPVLFIHGYLQGPFFTPKFVQGLNRAGIHLIAPSRPGFGYSSPSKSRRDFDRTVVADTLALVEELGLQAVSLCVHQGGASHGFRIAKALGSRVRDMLLVGAGIPIDEDVHLTHMDPQTRFAAVATRHAPSVMKMVMSVGLPVYKKRGPRAFLEKQFSKAPGDLETLSKPSLMKVQAEGLYHAVEQGGEAWVRDGASAMADWSDDFEAVTAPQTWLQAEDDSIISSGQVADYLKDRPNIEFRALNGHGINILHTAVPEIISELSRLR